VTHCTLHSFLPKMADSTSASQLTSSGVTAPGSSDAKKDSDLQSSIDASNTEAADSQLNGQPAGSSSTTINGTADHPMNESNPSDTQSAGTVGETRIPAKKDVTLKEFISKMDEHAPIIPDAVTNYYFTLAGLPPPPETPLPLARLLSLATQKFVADIAADAYQYARIRAATSSGPIAGMPGMPAPGGGPPGQGGAGGAPGAAGAAGGKDDKGKHNNLGGPRSGFGIVGQSSSTGRTVLTMEDLGMAVGEYGVNVKRGEFYR